MAWAVVLDDKISLLRHHDSFKEHTHYDLCKSLAISITKRLCEVAEYDCLTVVHPDDGNDTPVLHPFTHRPEVMRDAIIHLPEPSPMAQLNRNFNDLMEWAVLELFRYWGPSYPIQILVFTDGGATPFSIRHVNNQCFPNWSKKWPTVTFFFVALCTGQLSDDLLQVHHQFVPNSVIIPLNSHRISNTTLADFSTEGTNTVLRSCLPLPVSILSEPLSPTKVNTPVHIRFGHLGSEAHLVPAIRLKANYAMESPPKLNLEIFGFLHISDLSNPPVSSRHQVRVTAGSEHRTFLLLLLNAMQHTKAVAMCTISTQQDTNQSEKATQNSSFFRHGFLHQYDAKMAVLLLSIFHQDCTGLPWIGQFQHLAPVANFAGTQLYDDRDGSSPFPVRIPDQLSYVSESSVPGRLSAAPGAPPPEPFRYLSWVSPATLTADVNKLLRLGRRLPDKATLFFKEFTRLRTAALAYGCLDVLHEVVELTKAAHPSFAEGTASGVLSGHLKNMCRMLSEPDFRPDIHTNP